MRIAPLIKQRQGFEMKLTGTMPERLVENTVRYDGENLSKTLESGGCLCYNYTVNDVL